MPEGRLPGHAPSRAPDSDIGSFTRERFVYQDVSHDIYRKGTGPAVLVMTEMPGISPQVLGFADRVVSLGCTAVLPDLFGTAGRDPHGRGKAANALYMARSLARACISREFTAFAIGRSSPVVSWLRALAAAELDRCGGPGVGVVGMCFTGGFALAMAVDSTVLAPVMAQPSSPIPITRKRRCAIDCSDSDLATVAGRCRREGLRVLGLRFRGDPSVPDARFDLLRQHLGDGFIAVELEQSDRHPDGPLPRAHSVLTADLIDVPGTPTRSALQQVLDLLHEKLLTA